MSDGEVLVVAEVCAVRDLEALQQYQLAARAQYGRFGGTVIGRGGEPVEGVPPFGRVLIQRWPSAKAFLNWQASPEYQPLKQQRLACADMRITIVPVSG